MSRLDLHYKANLPEETVKRIKNILKAYNIEAEEEWTEQNKIGTSSLRLWLKGTELGTNGKGLSREYARASAYAELMERIQNCFLVRMFLTKQFTDDKEVYLDKYEKQCTIEELAYDTNAFMKMFFEVNKASSFDEKKRLLSKVQLLEYELTGEKDIFTGIPFINIRNDEVVYLPYNLYTWFYGSNGMCAGNTKNEALIQGLSEILERYVQRQVVKKRYALPDIPNQAIKKYPEISKRMEALKESKQFSFILKDCSLGGKYPVVALVVIEKNTGNYGIKFGAHPNYGIAMERAITEATQGLEIGEYAKKSKLNFFNDIVDDQYNLSNMYKSGHGQYPFEILFEKPTFSFKEVRYIDEEDDDSILKYYIEEVIGKEFDILYRDREILGFPAYQIIIPGMSELNYVEEERFNDLALRVKCEKLFQNVSLINKENVKYLKHTLLAFSKDEFSNSMRDLHGKLPSKISILGEELHLGWLYCLVLCDVMLGEYISAAKYMKILMDLGEDNSETSVYYRALYQYILGMARINDHIVVVRYLSNFFTEEIIKEIDSKFVNPNEIFVREYGKSFENCSYDYEVYMQLINLIKKLQM